MLVLLGFRSFAESLHQTTLAAVSVCCSSRSLRYNMYGQMWSNVVMMTSPLPLSPSFYHSLSFPNFLVTFSVSLAGEYHLGAQSAHSTLWPHMQLSASWRGVRGYKRAACDPTDHLRPIFVRYTRFNNSQQQQQQRTT